MEAQLPRGTAVMPAGARVHFDGACDPAPGGGIATYGFVVDGELHWEEKGLAVPPWTSRATNNVAEYVGAIRALEWLKSNGYRGEVLVQGDSQLVVRQINGEYDVKAEHLKEYHDHLAALSRSFSNCRFEWVPREENERADALSKEALAEARPEAERVAGRKRRSGDPARD